MKIAEHPSNGKKTLWVKEKLLVTSNFSFSHTVVQKACISGASKGVIVWEWVKDYLGATHHGDSLSPFFPEHDLIHFLDFG